MNERSLTQAPSSTRRPPARPHAPSDGAARGNGAAREGARDPRSTKTLVQLALARFGLSVVSGSR